MAKRPSKHLRPARPLSAGSHGWVETKGGRSFVVRSVTGAAAVKTYVCPGCLRTIPEGVAHVVAWPREASLLTSSPVDDRRHWHSACWQRKR